MAKTAEVVGLELRDFFDFMELNMESLIIIFHWRYFDVHLPLRTIRDFYQEDVEPKGLLCVDSCGTPAERSTSFLGIPRISPRRLDFYRHCAGKLQDQYNQVGLELLQDERPAQAVLTELALHYGKVEVWLPQYPGSEEKLFREELERDTPAQVDFHLMETNTLIDAPELPFAIANIPDTFSKFRRKVEKKPFASCRFGARYDVFPEDHSPGRQRLTDYIFTRQLITTYKETRNGLGPGDYASRLSRWLATGMVSAKEVGGAILFFEEKYVKNESTYWLLFELLWRDYFHFLHRRIGDQLFQPQGMKKRRSPGLNDNVGWVFSGSNDPMRFQEHERQEVEQIWQRFRAWSLACTGDEFIDAIMKELYFTGDVSNRARQCAASYLIHDLHVPWWWGAQWFEYLLYDYDVSSNWGNWAYIGGVGADSRPIRRFNIKHQAKTHDPDRSYRSWVEKQQWSIPVDSLPQEIPGHFR